MRHGKHRHGMGLTKEHRAATLAALAAALFTHGRITTTLAKARALRPFAEKVITKAKKAAATEDKAVKVHYRRLAMAVVRNEDVLFKLFNETVNEFMNRQGGYTRIYKLVRRATTDAAEMAIIELVKKDDAGYKKSRRPAGSTARAKKASEKKEVAAEKSAEQA